MLGLGVKLSLPVLLFIAWLLDKNEAKRSFAAWEEVAERMGLSLDQDELWQELQGTYRGYAVRVWVRSEVEGSGRTEQEVFYTEITVEAQEEALGSVQVNLLSHGEIPRALRKQGLSFSTAFEVRGDDLGRIVFEDEEVQRKFMELRASGGDVLFGAGRLMREQQGRYTKALDLMGYITKTIDAVERLDTVARRQLEVVEELSDDVFSTGLW